MHRFSGSRCGRTCALEGRFGTPASPAELWHEVADALAGGGLLERQGEVVAVLGHAGDDSLLDGGHGVGADGR